MKRDIKSVARYAYNQYAQSAGLMRLICSHQGVNAPKIAINLLRFSITCKFPFPHLISRDTRKKYVSIITILFIPRHFWEICEREKARKMIQGIRQFEGDKLYIGRQGSTSIRRYKVILFNEWPER